MKSVQVQRNARHAQPIITQKEQVVQHVLQRIVRNVDQVMENVQRVQQDFMYQIVLVLIVQ